MSRQSYSRSPSAPPPAASTLVPQSAARNLNALDSPLRPCYYLERPDGTRTALIEVDQLPDLFRIRGLSPKLSAADTAGMTSVGIKEGGQRKYTVEVADSSATPHLGEPSKHTEPENAPVTITATPSSKAPVSRPPFKLPREAFFANYTTERFNDRVQRQGFCHRCPNVSPSL